MSSPTTAAAPRKRSHIIVQWFDTLFIMALCFVTLLTTMLLQGKVLAGDGDAPAKSMDYTVYWGSGLAVLLMFGVYVWYVLRHSEHELKDMVNHVYGPKPESKP